MRKFPQPQILNFAFDSLEARRMLSWGSVPMLVGQDVAASEYPNITGQGEVVAVIDSGWDFTSPELAGHLWTNPNPNDMAGYPDDVNGWDFYDNNNNPFDQIGHGAQVTGIIANSAFTYDGAEYQGVAPGVKILPLKVWDTIAGQPSVAFDQNVGKALTYLVQLIEEHPNYNIVAVNLSVHAVSQASYDEYEEPQIQELANLGVFIAAASGNEGMTDAVDYPAADPNVFAIGGVYGAGPDVDQVTPDTNVSSKIALLAPSIDTPIIDDGDPGVNPTTGQGTPVGLAGDGTSYAAPWVTGAAALIKQVNPDFTAAQIMAILQQSGTPVYDPADGLTFERLDIAAAITLAYKDTGVGTPPPSTPFSGTPIGIPGLIQAANFDDGGQGVAYNNPDPGHSTGIYRSTTLAIEKIAKKQYAIGYTKAAEWLQYTVNVASTHKYDFTANLSNIAKGATFHIDVDGVDVTGELSVPDTGSYSTFEAITKSKVSLSAGSHVIRFVFDTNSTHHGYAGDLEWLDVELTKKKR